MLAFIQQKLLIVFNPVLFTMNICMFFICCKTNQHEVIYSDQALQCRNKKEVESALGKKVTFLGCYRIKSFYAKKNTYMKDWPVIMMADSHYVLMESLWNDEKKPEDAAVEIYLNKEVSVTGILHSQPPGSIQNISVPCLSPVYSVDILKQGKK
jgi:hypothetical protein